jgi:hypothetical protein
MTFERLTQKHERDVALSVDAATNGIKKGTLSHTLALTSHPNAKILFGSVEGTKRIFV